MSDVDCPIRERFDATMAELRSLTRSHYGAMSEVARAMGANPKTVFNWVESKRCPDALNWIRITTYLEKRRQENRNHENASQPA